MKQQKVAVIGAGIAGLASAARLAARGFEVAIYERNAVAGGKLGLLQDAGYSWDTGPSLFTQPHLMVSLFADCGFKLEDFFSYRALGAGTQYFWEDGTRLHAAPERRDFVKNAVDAFGIQADKIDDYLEDAKALYQKVGSLFLDEPIHRLSTWKPSRVLSALKVLKLDYLRRSLHGYNARQLQHPKLVQMMDRMATYNGSDPFQCPAMLSMIAHLEFGEGCWYAEGGMISIPNALRRLCESLGVQFYTGNSVTRIILERARVTGIELAGAVVPAAAVVSNSDVFLTYRDLLQDAETAERIRRQERSSSGLVFYWGISRPFPELRLHNVFFSGDYKAEFGALYRAEVSSDPTVYINITSKEDSSHAPLSCENWFVLINSPAREQALSKAEIDVIRTNVLQKLSRILGADIASLIQTERIMGPAEIAQTSGAYLGALYGTASNSAMAAFARHANFSKKYPGLFFAGGTVHPGGGIPLCLRAAKLAANEATAYLSS